MENNAALNTYIRFWTIYSVCPATVLLTFFSFHFERWFHSPTMFYVFFAAQVYQNPWLTTCVCRKALLYGSIATPSYRSYLLSVITDNITAYIVGYLRK